MTPGDLVKVEPLRRSVVLWTSSFQAARFGQRHGACFFTLKELAVVVAVHLGEALILAPEGLGWCHVNELQRIAC